MQVVARRYQRDWLQVRTVTKSLKSLYIWGKDANRLSGAAGTLISFLQRSSRGITLCLLATESDVQPRGWSL